MKALKVKQLIGLLQECNQELEVIVLNDKDQAFGIIDLNETGYAYFGNSECESSGNLYLKLIQA